MSTIISIVHDPLAFLLNLSLAGAIRLILGSAVGGSLLVLFKPLLVGVARAFILLVKPKFSKEERLARAQYSTRWP